MQQIALEGGYARMGCGKACVYHISPSRTTHTGESVDFSVSAGGFGPFT